MTAVELPGISMHFPELAGIGLPKLAGIGLPSKHVPEDMESGVSYLLTAPQDVLLGLTDGKHQHSSVTV